MAPKLENPATLTTTKTTEFIFPVANSKITPDPTKFFAQNLLSSPLPTTSFFTNFIVGNGDQPSFIHPYFIKLSLSSLSLSYPSISSSSSSISQTFSPDLTISTLQPSRHLITSFSDLTVTVDFLQSDFRFHLARGCPFITLEVSRQLCISFSMKSPLQSLSSTNNNKKHKFELQNKQTWVIYSSSSLNFEKQDDTHVISKKTYSGVIRVAILPSSKSNKSEEVLDLYSTCYPISGELVLCNPFKLSYKWEKKGWGELLMLAHPLHLKLLSVYNCGIKVVNDLKFKSIDGELVGVVGNYWDLRVDNVPISWHSKRGISEEFYPEIVTALWKDVGCLDSTPITTIHCFHYGMQISRAARLGLIAEEVNCMDVIPAIRKFLRDTIEPWLVGTFEKNGFLYEQKWGGIVSKWGLNDSNSDYGFGLFNNHHFSLGYFVFSIAVLAKFDPEWGAKFKGQAYAMVGSYMNLGLRKEKSKYTKLRSFDAYKLHSWTALLQVNGRNSENPSASINAYYAAALLGRVYGDDHLVAVGSTLASFEMEAVKTWWHVKEDGVYEGVFKKMNELVGILWENKREDKLWGCNNDGVGRILMQMRPLMPVLSDILFSDVGFVRQVVEWAAPSLAKKETGDYLKGHVYGLEAIFDGKSALNKIRNLKNFDEGNSLSNMLWWVYSRIGKEKFCEWCMKDEDECWFCANS